MSELLKLVDHGADVNGVDKKKRTALHILCSQNNQHPVDPSQHSEGQVSMMRALLEKDSDPIARDVDDMTPAMTFLRHCTSIQSLDLLKLLVQSGGVSIGTDSVIGRNLLHWAVWR